MAIDYSKQSYQRTHSPKRTRKPIENSSNTAVDRSNATPRGTLPPRTSRNAGQPFTPRKPLRRMPETYIEAPRNPLPIAWIVAGILGVILIITVMGTAYHRHKEKQIIAQKTQIDKAPKQAAVKPAPPTVQKGPKFDFYTILPNNDTKKLTTSKPGNVENTEQPKDKTLANARPTVSSSKTTPEKDKKYMLDVATYKEIDKAESLRARLLLMGYHPMVSKTRSGWYRIEIGPYNSLRDGDEERLRLEKKGISGSFVHPITSQQVKQA